MNTADVERLAEVHYTEYALCHQRTVPSWESLAKSERALAVLAMRAAIAALGQTDGYSWQPIEGATHYKGYLVQHQDDLYPVTAYSIPGEGWYYLQDGPEDVIEPGDHQNTPLKRAPTHYREIMDCPLVEAEALGLPLPAPPEAKP